MTRFKLPFLVLAMMSLACAPASLSFHVPTDNSAQSGGNTANGNTAQGGIVCTPAGTGTPTATGGLSGSMYYLAPGSTPLNSVSDYITTGQLDPSTFYFSQLDVPTEIFTSGFTDASGNLLATPSGTVLYENFALDLHSVLSLGTSDAEGYYQFALLADDGAILDAVDGNGKLLENLVSNDGLHATKMGCGTQAVYFDHKTKLDIHLRYYQGPRDEIALIALWRPVNPNSKLDQTYCGDEGNTTFFDPTTNPPKATAEYTSLTTTHKWAPIKAVNYSLPGGATNPCAI